MLETGKHRGNIVHSRVRFISKMTISRDMLTSLKYFQLKSWSDLQKNQWIDTHSGAYASYVYNHSTLS